MKTILPASVIGGLVIMGLIFMTPGCQNQLSHVRSNFVGLHRTVTLYDANGKVIRGWTTDSKVEDRGGSCRFLVNGKAITISGTFILEEK